MLRDVAWCCERSAAYAVVVLVDGCVILCCL